ncbi:hypothetical protein Cantr_08005 [Candida viswanathii]|uniref:Uncharacterized protein n=1 Tax=Candida viswanathii TaxID=5486 RepID=A0A367Y4A7_9ASCO|nr:hypothetical protein Cantr_08005 [Candida viswanathii]
MTQNESSRGRSGNPEMDSGSKIREGVHVLHTSKKKLPYQGDILLPTTFWCYLNSLCIATASSQYPKNANYLAVGHVTFNQLRLSRSIGYAKWNHQK